MGFATTPYRLCIPELPTIVTITVDPRVARSRAKIFEAVIEELATVGYAALTIEGIAARAGVGKTTIYRHWDSKARLVHEAVSDHKPPFDAADTGELRGDLVAILGSLVTRLSSGGPGTILLALITAAELDPELEALHKVYVRQRRRPLMDALTRAVERGELPADTDLPVASDMLAGPLFFRRYISRDPVTVELVEQLVDTLLPQLASIRAS